MVVEYFSKFSDGCVAIFKKSLDCTEESIGYVADKFKKVLTVRDLAFMTMGFTGATFIAWQIYLWYAGHSVLTGSMIIGKIVYKLVPGTN